MVRQVFQRGWMRTGACGLGLALAVGLLPSGLTPAAAAPAAKPSVSAARSHGTLESGDLRTEGEALTEAGRSGKSVEVTALRGESRDVFATPDGYLEAREYLRPVRARSGGTWRPIDTELSRTDADMVAPKAATLDMAFSGGGDTPMVRLRRSGRELPLSWPTPLPTPVLDGATATYPNVLPEVDLRLSAQADGFSQLLVVKSAQAAANPELQKIRLGLGAEGVRLTETAGGGLEAVDEGAGSSVFEASTPLMWDSSKVPGVAGEARATASEPARLRAGEAGGSGEPGAGESGKLAPIAVNVPDDGQRLELTPDHDVLRGKDTVYPVFIDPQIHAPRATAWTMASKYWANSPQWKFNGKSTEGLGYCEWEYCNPHDTKRLFYRIPTSAFSGKTILSAELVVRNTWSASCADRQVELWRTKDIDSATTWNSQNAAGFWIDKLAERSFAYGFEGCAAGDAEFSVKSAVQEAANKKWPTMTFGLRAGSESDRYAWKRFSDKAHLRVKYNRPPGLIKMSQLLMEYGGQCQRPDSAPAVRTLGKLYVNDVGDPDGDPVSVQVEAAWDSGDGKGVVPRWKPGRTTAKKAGSDFAITLPSGIPSDRRISWYARSHDGAQYSPWSSTGSATSCYFHYDKNTPRGPRLTSGEYPASNPEDPDDPWYDGVGQYGEFTLDSPSTDVTRYRYGINGSPSAKNELTTSGGAARTVSVLPSRPGLNFVTAQAFDKAGNASEPYTYQFRVRSGQPERATWQLDEPAQATEATGSTPARAARLHGGAQTGAPGAVRTGLKLDGTSGYAATDIPVVDTDRGFTVSAWVQLDTVPDHAAIIAAQPGNHRPGFELYYSAVYQRWVFNQYSSDAPDASVVRAMAAQPGGVRAGVWTHLVGSFDSTGQRLQLFVNGTRVGETTYPTAWNARRGLRIGAGSYSGKADSFFPGTIDELQIFDKGISPEEVTRLYAKETIGDPGRPAKAIFPLDEESGATEVTAHGGVLPARFHGGAAPGNPGVAGNALTLDGTDDYARVGAPHLNSSRSFAVALWAKLPETKPGRAAVAISQGGTHKAGFELYYSAAYQRWVFDQHADDTPSAAAVRAMQPEGTTAPGGQWTHLAGVHDTVADTLTLYVNGQKAGSTKLGGGWYAAGPMFIGAGSYDQKPGNFFPGQIDDVRLFDRPVAEGEVLQLFRARPRIQGRWKFEEAAGTPVTSPDASAHNRSATLHGGATIGAGMLGDGGLSLDGVNDYAATAKLPMDTGSSYTVTAWAQAAATPQGNATLLSGEGNQRAAFAVRYVPDTRTPDALGRWEITLPDRDAPEATTARADNSQFYDVRQWNHLALVYDGFSRQAHLYVNGELEESACTDADGDGRPDDAACGDRVSSAENALTFTAAGALDIGRTKPTRATSGSEHWPGTIDDVWTFQGALTEDQIWRLAHDYVDPPTEVPSA
ncbi:LamG-like jellyroll fold domain-containing protein [Streptomyces buecherae]|uniref:LamG-like jellyroll fold domain-containing protein n=1 Tax=Streptomyces buecherae TaxID=2763006 RepID=UPI003651A87B